MRKLYLALALAILATSPSGAWPKSKRTLETKVPAPPPSRDQTIFIVNWIVTTNMDTHNVTAMTAYRGIVMTARCNGGELSILLKDNDRMVGLRTGERFDVAFTADKDNEQHTTGEAESDVAVRVTITKDMHEKMLTATSYDFELTSEGRKPIDLELRASQPDLPYEEKEKPIYLPPALRECGSNRKEAMQ